MIIEGARVKECETHGLRGVMLAGRWEGDQGDVCMFVTGQTEPPEIVPVDAEPFVPMDIECRRKLDEHDGTVEVRRRNVEP